MAKKFLCRATRAPRKKTLDARGRNVYTFRIKKSNSNGAERDFSLGVFIF
jgi:hypothetical protein